MKAINLIWKHYFQYDKYLGHIWPKLYSGLHVKQWLVSSNFNQNNSFAYKFEVQTNTTKLT
jgi:hypothetical protein